MFLFCLRFAINAAVGFCFALSKLENMGQILLRCCYAAGILALYNILYLFGKGNLFLFAKNTVFDYIDGDIRIDIAENIKVNLHIRIDFDDILRAHFLAVDIFYDCNSAVKLIKLKVIINLHAVARFDMVDNNTVFY